MAIMEGKGIGARMMLAKADGNGTVIDHDQGPTAGKRMAGIDGTATTTGISMEVAGE